MTDVTVIIPTFGNRVEWDQIAERAARSVFWQTASCNMLRIHGRDLADARNSGAARAVTDWLIFLDADDELDERYVESMLAGEGDIRRPSTLGIQNGVEDDYPVMIPERNLFQSNYVVIGAMMSRKRFLDSGGFDPSLPCLEDWDLMLKLWTTGAEIKEVPEAIYRVHVREDSRNQNTERHGQAYSEIRRRYASFRQSSGQQ